MMFFLGLVVLFIFIAILDETESSSSSTSGGRGYSPPIPQHQWKYVEGGGYTLVESTGYNTFREYATGNEYVGVGYGTVRKT